MKLPYAMSLKKVIGAVVMGLLVFGSVQAATAAEEQVILSSAWGEKSQGVGLINVPEHEVVGPLSFCVEGQQVYLLDTVNKRVLKSDAQGHLDVLAENVLASAICSDGQGGVWVRVGDTIQQVNSEGKSLAAKKVALATGNKPPIEGYGVELMRDASGAVDFRKLDQSVVSIEAGKQTAKAQGTPHDLLYSIKRLSGNDVRVLGEDADGKVLLSVPIQVDAGYAGTVLFKGVDAYGNIYVELECIGNDTIGLEVHVFTPEGERLRKLSLFNSYFSTVYKKTEVAPDGSIYQMKTTPEGVEVVCYKGGGES